MGDELIEAGRTNDLYKAVDLIFDGVDVNYLDNNNQSPLNAASAYGHAYLVKMLISNGADVNNKTTNFGVSPLYAASLYGHADVVKILLSKGATIDKETIEVANNPEIVDILKKSPVMTLKKNNKATTPFEKKQNQTWWNPFGSNSSNYTKIDETYNPLTLKNSGGRRKNKKSKKNRNSKKEKKNDSKK